MLDQASTCADAERSLIGTSRPIPTDILLDILVHIHPAADMTIWQFRRTMASLSLVCRSFRDVCHPHVYEYVSLQHAWPEYPGKADRLERWLDLLENQNPQIILRSACVRYCTLSIQDWDAGRWRANDDPSRVQLSSQYSTSTDPGWIVAVAAFSNLQGLTLWNAGLSAELVTTLATLSQLRALSLHSCRRVGAPPAVLPQMHSPGVVSLEISSTGWGDEWLTAILHLVDRSKLRSLKTNDRALVLAILNGSGELELEELDMGIVLMAGESDFEIAVAEGIARCPKLKMLALQPRFGRLPLDLHKRALHSLTCNLDVANASLPNKGEHFPVVHLNICGKLASLAPDSQYVRHCLHRLADVMPPSLQHLTLPIETPEYFTPGFILRVPRLTLFMLILESGSIAGEFRACVVSIGPPTTSSRTQLTQTNRRLSREPARTSIARR